MFSRTNLKSIFSNKKNIPIGILGIVLIIGAFFGGMNIGIITAENSVKITSLTENQEVHSMIVVDASMALADEIQVLVNDVIVANYLPYYWNNMLEPVGTYNIVVRALINTVWKEDSTMVIIPETFTVPIDYEFTEDFVVHTGQTVYFQDYYFDLSQDIYENGDTPLDERTHYSINNFGILYVVNTQITCNYFRGEENSETYLGTGDHITQKGFNNLGLEQAYNGPVFDDTAKLYHDESETWTEVYRGNDIWLYYPNTDHYYTLLESASLETWDSTP